MFVLVSQMEFESFTRDINRLLKDHRDCTKKMDLVLKNSTPDELEPFFSTTKT